jgi:L,D-peptidoglycan transpeptidase YkuD (ErfK/YbiS/YcfS/YnhG family)
MQRANQAGGVVRAPEECTAAQTLLVRADAEVRLQGKRSFLSRDYGQAEDLVSQALQAAESCELHARAVRDRVRERARASLDEAEAWIGRAAALARHVPDEEGIKKELLRAEIALGEGRAGFEREQYERAEEAAGRARAVVAATVSEIARFVERFAADPRRASWKRWVQETVRDSRRTGRPAIVVDKLRRHLLLIRGEEEIASYAVDLGAGGIGYKTRSGDEATPEGRYRVTEVRGPGRTRYYRALMLDYPNPEDRARFRRLVRSGRVSHRQEIGGNIEIHGKGGRGTDWTQGCVALENGDMDDLVPRVQVGTPVTIVGMIPEGALP